MRVRFRLQAIADADAFRTQIRQGLQAPMRQARALGYSGEIVQSAVFAVVALLDESVLNLQEPVFAQWARQPLQEELFGGHLAGETFFRDLRGYLQQPDSPQLADVLELYCLCLLLGYRGRHALGGSGEMYAQLREARERIRRIRGAAHVLAAETAPAAAVYERRHDTWMQYLLWAASLLALVLLVAYIGFELSLASGAAVLRGSTLNGL